MDDNSIASFSFSYTCQKNFSTTSGLRVRLAFENVLSLAGTIPLMRESSEA